MHKDFQRANDLAPVVIDAAVAVQKHFGVGLLENIYKMCLAHELRLRGHTVEVEKAVTIRYKDFAYSENLRLDLLVDGCLVVECKSLDEKQIDMPRHKAQCLSYMKLLNAPLGLVVNFGDYRLGKRGIGRVILKDADAEDGGMII